MNRRTTVAATLVASVVMGAGVGSLRAQGTKVPVYTAQQEARGAAQFNANCSQCHGKNLEGVEAPALVGLDVMGNWITAQGLYDYISVAMPPTAAGQLGEPVYIDIIAHILAVNGAPAGSKQLTLAELPSVDLVSVTGQTAASGAPKPAGSPQRQPPKHRLAFRKPLRPAANCRLSRPALPQRRRRPTPGLACRKRSRLASRCRRLRLGVRAAPTPWCDKPFGKQLPRAARRATQEGPAGLISAGTMRMA